MSSNPIQHKKLAEFLDNNDIKMGTDFQMSPPLYHHSLEDGYFNYFNTYSTVRDSFHLLISTDWCNRESMSFNYSQNGFKESCVRCITGFHRFFELYIKDILSRYDEKLATDHFKNITDVKAFLQGQTYIPNPKAENRTIEFNESLKRFKLFKELFDSNLLDSDFISSSQYFYLLTEDAIETLDSLCFWRNRISHNGKKVLNYLALEYLVSQRVTPLAIEMYTVEKPAMQDYFPKYLRNAFKIQLLDEIANTNAKFGYNDFCNATLREGMQNNLMYLAHLKELGRASFLSPFALFAPGTYEEHHNKPLREKYERFVKVETKNKNFYKLLVCPCCGSKSLVVYRIEFESIFLKKGEVDEKFNCICYACTYEINSFNIDPFHIGLFSEPLFNKKTKAGFWEWLKSIFVRLKDEKK